LKTLNSETVTENFLYSFPWNNELRKIMKDVKIPEFRESNNHIHTPYSFSAFDSLETAFAIAKKENIAALGINDFFVTDGYEEFHDGCIHNNIFPLFNIEFIGLLKKEQQDGIRINDPNNPGRIYFCGKGLDYPFTPGWRNKRRLNRVIRESQNQIREMTARLNDIIRPVNPMFSLSYEVIKRKYAHELVRERHLAKAVRHIAVECFKDPGAQLNFIETLYGGKKSQAGITDAAKLENEIRSNLLKAGGSAFVAEDESSFLSLKKLIRIITKAGGIPCYPVLLDDQSGKYTEFEADTENLHRSLTSLGIRCIELIPGRNDHSILKSFVEYFDSKGFVITFGTEHNTPDLTPLTVTARGSVPLDESLKIISWQGVCVIAAHQYLRAHDRQGYVLDNGAVSHNQKNDLVNLGQQVIEYFLNKWEYES